MFRQIQRVVTGDLASNRERIMLLYAGRTGFAHFCAVRNCIWTVDLYSLWGSCTWYAFKISSTHLNRSREIPPEAVIFASFLNFDNCQPEVASDVISGVVVDLTGIDVGIKFLILDQTVLEIYASEGSGDFQIPSVWNNISRLKLIQGQRWWRVQKLCNEALWLSGKSSAM